MASHYYGINRGQTEFSVVESTSTNSTDIELVIDLTKNVTKSELMVKLEELANYILTKSTYPPL